MRLLPDTGEETKGERFVAPLSMFTLSPSWQVRRAGSAYAKWFSYFLPRIWVSTHAASCSNRAPAGTAPAYPARIPLESSETA